MAASVWCRSGDSVACKLYPFTLLDWSSLALPGFMEVLRQQTCTRCARTSLKVATRMWQRAQNTSVATSSLATVTAVMPRRIARTNTQHCISQLALDQHFSIWIRPVLRSTMRSSSILIRRSAIHPVKSISHRTTRLFSMTQRNTTHSQISPALSELIQRVLTEHEAERARKQTMLNEAAKKKMSRRRQEIYKQRQEFYKQQLEKLNTGSQCSQALYRINSSRAPDGLERGLNILEHMQTRNIRFETNTHYNNLLWFYRKYEMLSEMWGTFNHMCESGIPITVVTYNHLVDAFGRKSLDLARMFITEMLKHGIFPNSTTYNMVLNLLSINGKFDEMLEMYKLMKSSELPGLTPNEYTFATLLHAASKARRMEFMEQLFADMKMQHVSKNVVHYTILLNADYSLEDWKKWYKLGKVPKQIRDRVIERDGVLLKDMKDHDVAPNLYTYTSLMSRAFKAGDHELMLKYYSEMLSKGIRPDVVTYGTLIQAMSYVRKFEEVDQLYKHIQQEQVEESIALLTIIAQSWIMRGDHQKAMGFLEPFLRAGQLDAMAATTLLIAYVRTGRVRDALKAWKHMLIIQGAQLTSQVYLPLLSAFASRGKVRAVQWLFNTVAQRNHRHVSMEDLMSGLIKAYAHRGDPYMALEVWDQCLLANLACTSHMVSYLFYACAFRGNAKALAIIERKLAQVGITINAHHLPSLIVAHARCGNIEACRKWLKTAEELQIQLTPRVYNICRDAGVETQQKNIA
jgi:pentatricopeptide repeat protein